MDVQVLLDELHLCCDLDEIGDWFNTHGGIISNDAGVFLPPRRFGTAHLSNTLLDNEPAWKFWLWMASDHASCNQFLDIVLPKLGFHVIWRAFGSPVRNGSDALVAMKQSDFPILSVCETLKYESRHYRPSY